MNILSNDLDAAVAELMDLVDIEKLETAVRAQQAERLSLRKRSALQLAQLGDIFGPPKTPTSKDGDSNG